jgi:CHAT domain-containing protein
VWELFERRLEAEDLLGAQARAKDIVDSFAASSAVAGDPEFHQLLTTLSGPDRRAVYIRLLELTGGPEGVVKGADESRNSRLIGLRLLASAYISAVEGQRAFTDQDRATISACAPLDAQLEEVKLRVAAGSVAAGDVAALTAAVRDYQALIAGVMLSARGKHQMGLKFASALESLGRAYYVQTSYGEAEICYRTAVQAYAEIGETRAAEDCAQRRDAAAQQQAPDADRKLQRLLTALGTAPHPSVERAQALAGLAELARDNGDRFEATERLTEAMAEMSAAGYRQPGLDGADRAVEDWMSVIPPGDGEDPTYFLRSISQVLTMQIRLASLRLQLMPKPGHALADLIRLSEIVAQVSDHTAAVHARLQARLGNSISGTAAEPSPQSTVEATTDYHTVMRLVRSLRDRTADRPDNARALERWRQQAADCVQLARKLGRPTTLAEALQAAAGVHLAAGDLAAAVPLLRQAYDCATSIAGGEPLNQAITAATSLAKTYHELGDRAAAVPLLMRAYDYAASFAGSQGLNEAITVATSLVKTQQDLGDYGHASNAAAQAINLIERGRYRLSAPFQQAAYLTPYLEIFSIGVLAAWKCEDYTTMIQRMELSKAWASVRQLFPPDRLDSDEAYETVHLGRLDQEVRNLGDAIHAERPDPRAYQLRAQRLDAWDLRAIARRDLVAHSVPVVTLDGIQSVLGEEEAIVYFYWLTRTTLLIVVITSAELAVESKEFSADDRARLDSLIEVLGSLRGSSLSLDNVFIAPLARLLTPADGRLLAGKKRLILSPHRLLHWYPFAAMPYRGQPLVRSFALRYVPNLTSLLVPRPPTGTRSVAVVGVSESPDGLAPLTHIRQEVTDIADCYRAAGVPVRLLTDPSRTDLVQALAGGPLRGAWCLHIATHIRLPDDTSRAALMDAALNLIGGAVDCFDIAVAELGCEIVVLSVSNAGQLDVRGRGMAEQSGDELFGLPAAFLEARCRSVLAPIWPADDETICSLVTAVHRHLARGVPADIALALAQREFLDSAGHRSSRAFYWASLVLLGVGGSTPA